MSGGAGGWLRPLTDVRAKPAVPFGGFHCIIDFPLSNCINSGICRVHVLRPCKGT
jgi:glucose-1-phosphate adenylyltransferase